MNERDQELSKAIDSLTKLREAIELNQFWHIGYLADEALGHVENATTMPKPSKIRDLFQRLGRAA